MGGYRIGVTCSLKHVTSYTTRKQNKIADTKTAGAEKSEEETAANPALAEGADWIIVNCGTAATPWTCSDPRLAGTSIPTVRFMNRDQ